MSDNGCFGIGQYYMRAKVTRGQLVSGIRVTMMHTFCKPGLCVMISGVCIRNSYRLARA